MVVAAAVLGCIRYALIVSATIWVVSKTNFCVLTGIAEKCNGLSLKGDDGH